MTRLPAGKAAELVEAQRGGGPWDVAPFGAGKFSETFSADSADGRYVLRVAPPDEVLQLFYEYRMMRQEPYLHERILGETDVPIPPIAAHDFSRELIDRDYLIMPRVEGVPLSEASLPPAAMERALRQWGRYVGTLHGLRHPSGRFGYLGDHRPMDPRPTWREAFEEMYRLELEDIVACGVYDRRKADEAMGLLRDRLEVFDNARVPRLLHGDLWVTNLLVRPDGEATALIDFDRACWGDVEWDLAIADYCGVLRPEFVNGYNETAPAPLAPDYAREPDAAVRRMFYLLYEHQKYIVISISSRRNDPARARRYAAESLAIMSRFRETGRAAF